jgi:Niemann-Pick C1 protein
VFAENMLLAIAAVFIAIEIITNIGIGLFVALIVFLVSFNLIGAMWVCNELFGGYVIEMNAIMVVNLVMSSGLAVEFCVHTAINFNK